MKAVFYRMAADRRNKNEQAAAKLGGNDRRTKAIATAISRDTATDTQQGEKSKKKSTSKSKKNKSQSKKSRPDSNFRCNSTRRFASSSSSTSSSSNNKSSSRTAVACSS